MKKLILFLVRKYLGLRLYEEFQFVNQKTNNRYYFSEEGIMRYEPDTLSSHLSGVSLNWLLDDECVIKRIESD